MSDTPQNSSKPPFEQSDAFKTLTAEYHFDLEAALREYIQYTRLNPHNVEGNRVARIMCIESQTQLSDTYWQTVDRMRKESGE